MKSKSSPENPETSFSICLCVCPSLQYGLQGPFLHHCSLLPPASDGFECMEFLLWVPNLHGQFYLLFYALVIYFSVRGEGLHMMSSELFF